MSKLTSGLIAIILSVGSALPCIAAPDATIILNAQKDYFSRISSVEFKSTQTVLLDPYMQMRIFNRTGSQPQFPFAIPQVSRFQDERFYFFEHIPPQQPYNTNASSYDGTTYTRFTAADRMVFRKSSYPATADPIGTDNPLLLLFAWAKRQPVEFSYRALHDESYWNGTFDIVSVRDSETSSDLAIVGLNLPNESRRLYAEATFSRALNYYPTGVTIYDLSSDSSTSSIIEEVKLLEVAMVQAGPHEIPVPVAISYHESRGHFPKKNRYELYDMKVNQPLSDDQFIPAARPEGYVDIGPFATGSEAATLSPSAAQERVDWIRKAQKADAEFFAKQNSAVTSRAATSPPASHTTGTAAHDLLEKALARARGESKKVFLLCVTSHSGWCQFFDRFHALPAVKEVLDRYYVVASIQIDKLPDGREVFSIFGDAMPPAWVILDPDKAVLGTSKCRSIGNVGYPTMPHEMDHYTKALQASSAIAPHELEVLTAELEKATPYYKPEKVRAASITVCKDDFQASTVASDLVTSALSVARAESKNVFLLSGFPECSWCKLFDRFHALPGVQSIMKKYYVIEKVDTENMADGEAVFKKYAEPGAPAWVVLDPSGKVLFTSYNAENDNVGYPASASETSHYAKALKATSSISETESKSLIESLLKTANRKAGPEANP